MKRLFAVSSSSSGWSSNAAAAVRFLLFVGLLLIPGSLIVLPLLGWIRHKAVHIEHTPEAHA